MPPKRATVAWYCAGWLVGAKSKERIWAGIIQTLATECTEDTEKCKNALCTLQVNKYINYIFQQPHHPPAAPTNTRSHRLHTPHPNPRSVLEHSHPVRSARDGRAGEWQEGQRR